ncbi:hypothetical protein N656DRAFT_800623 [Canariomyces notabilis]|uniref:Uncharacterized protein n=1 Tax=Canariomyces notabilis TaxID=2074819 RepID=A0AAN6QGB1_9PEZI|nr:hypothetical protein N656DRAFT_800623 [Canariomyces arenarius]
MLLSSLKDLAKLKNGRTWVFTTSRPHAQDIHREFDDPSIITRVDISAREADVAMFVKQQLENDDDLLELIAADGEPGYGPSLLDRIICSTARQASGMFLLAALQVEHIRASASIRDVNDALTSMPTGLSDMPLTVDELGHALVAEEAGEATPLPRQLDATALVKDKFIVNVCAGLVAVEPMSKRVRLVHATAMEYLDQLGDRHFALAEERITRACLAYLSFDEFANGPSPSDDSMERRLENFPFLQYAAKWWGWHLQKTRSLHLQEMALMLLKNHRSSISISQASHLPSFRFHNYSQLYPKNVNALHVAAQFGLDEFAKSVLADGNADLDSEDSFG